MSSNSFIALLIIVRLEPQFLLIVRLSFNYY